MSAAEPEVGRAPAAAAQQDAKFSRKQYKGTLMPWQTVTVKDCSVIVEGPSGGALKRLPAPLARARETVAAFEKAQRGRCKCSLCDLWYSDDSVKGTSCNKHVAAFRATRGLAVSGRRFENASFLYQEAKLCVFCAQLLTKRDDGSVFASSRTASAQPKGLASTIADEARLDGWIAADALAEEAEHFADNCALRRPAYQSSTVDGRAAALAVDGDAEAQGLHRVSCTRREYEAWWECDLWRGGDVDIASVKIYPFLAVRSSALSPNSRTPKALRAPVAVSVLVLKRPLGSVRLHDARKFAVAELVIDNDSQPCVEWLLPLGTRGACVRVQVHGAKALQLRQVTRGTNPGNFAASAAADAADAAKLTRRQSSSSSQQRPSFSRSSCPEAPSFSEASSLRIKVDDGGAYSGTSTLPPTVLTPPPTVLTPIALSPARHRDVAPLSRASSDCGSAAPRWEDESRGGAGASLRSTRVSTAAAAQLRRGRAAGPEFEAFAVDQLYWNAAQRYDAFDEQRNAHRDVERSFSAGHLVAAKNLFVWCARRGHARGANEATGPGGAARPDKSDKSDAFPADDAAPPSEADLGLVVDARAVHAALQRIAKRLAADSESASLPAEAGVFLAKAPVGLLATMDATATHAVCDEVARLARLDDGPAKMHRPGDAAVDVGYAQFLALLHAIRRRTALPRGALDVAAALARGARRAAPASALRQRRDDSERADHRSAMQLRKMDQRFRAELSGTHGTSLADGPKASDRRHDGETFMWQTLPRVSLVNTPSAHSLYMSLPASLALATASLAASTSGALAYKGDASVVSRTKLVHLAQSVSAPTASSGTVAYHDMLQQRRRRQRRLLATAKPPRFSQTCDQKACGLCLLYFPTATLSSSAAHDAVIRLLRTFGMDAADLRRRGADNGSLCFHRLPLCRLCSQFFDADVEGGLAQSGNAARDTAVNFEPFFDSTYPTTTHPATTAPATRPSTSKR